MSQLLALFLIFAQIGFLTIGGGLAMLPVMQQTLVSRGLMTIQETVDMVAISQMTPGPFAVNAATYTGMKLYGVWGATAATLGVMTPSIVIISIVARYFFKFKSSRPVNGALSGVRPIIPGLIAAAMLDIGRASLTGILPAVIALASFVLVYRKLNPAWVILGAGVLGAFALR